MTDLKWKRFEKLAYEIQRELSPNARVTLNDSILGADSKTNRQIDISIRENIGQYCILVVIDCKDYKEPVDVKDLEEFAGLVRDVRANKSAIISSNGFTEAAVNVAKTHGIDLFRLVDTKSVDWRTYVAIPALLQRTYMKFSMSVAGIGHIVLPADPEDLINLDLHRDDGTDIGDVKRILHAMWDKQEIPHVPGTRELLIGKDLTVHFMGRKSKVDVSATVLVVTEFYFGPLPVDVRGLHDVRDGGLITRKLRTGIIEPAKIYKGLVPGWNRIDDPLKLSVRPVMTLSFSDAYSGEEPEGSNNQPEGVGV